MDDQRTASTGDTPPPEHTPLPGLSPSGRHADDVGAEHVAAEAVADALEEIDAPNADAEAARARARALAAASDTFGPAMPRRTASQAVLTSPTARGDDGEDMAAKASTSSPSGTIDGTQDGRESPAGASADGVAIGADTAGPATEVPPARKATTIYDVAKAAGVAPSTVSRAFSRPGRVNAETSQRIRAIAAELGYRSAPLPRPIVSSQTRIIALVVADITNPVFFDITRGVQDAAAEKGYTILLLDSRESDVQEREDLERVLPAVEGVVLSSSRMSDSTIRVLAKQKPMSIINRVVTEIPSVVPDSARGIRRGLELLGEHGHESVSYLGGPEASWADGMRWRAMREGAHELSMTVRRIGPLEPTVSGAVDAVLAWEERPTSAVIAYNDLLAVGFMRAMQLRGHRVPEDVSVVGFDNIFVAELVAPGLTTIATPRRALGAAAVRHLALGRQSPSTRIAPTVLPVKLMERGSVGPPRRDLD